MRRLTRYWPKLPNSCPWVSLQLQNYIRKGTLLCIQNWRFKKILIQDFLLTVLAWSFNLLICAKFQVNLNIGLDWFMTKNPTAEIPVPIQFSTFIVSPLQFKNMTTLRTAELWEEIVLKYLSHSVKSNILLNNI